MDVLPCPECKPPLVQDATSDYYTCAACGFQWRLDRDTNSWWPESYWDQRNEVVPAPDGSTPSNGGTV